MPVMTSFGKVEKRLTIAPMSAAVPGSTEHEALWMLDDMK